tara:strand:- start:5593 stop:5934 length:342 start_codon:yes stop_codon:yes gene_type:complete
MIKNIEPTIDDVNELLIEAFGDTKGNCRRLNTLGLGTYDEYVPSKELKLIVQETFFGPELIGHFTNLDGSALTLYRRGFFWINEERANEYARLYRERFGGEVEINVNGEETIH